MSVVGSRPTTVAGYPLPPASVIGDFALFGESFVGGDDQARFQTKPEDVRVGMDGDDGGRHGGRHAGERGGELGERFRDGRDGHGDRSPWMRFQCAVATTSPPTACLGRTPQAQHAGRSGYPDDGCAIVRKNAGAAARLLHPNPARRGHQIAAVAVARKFAVLCWHMLTKEQDYLSARPR